MSTRHLPLLTMLPALLTLVLGLAATAALFGWTHDQEQAMEQLIFERRANFRMMTVRQGLEEVVETINDVNRAVSTFTPVSRAQFHTFVAPLARGNPYPSSISYTRLLKHAERAAYEARMQRVMPGFAIRELAGDKLAPAAVRENYLVVEYLEPGEVDGLVGLGYDVLSEPYLNHALARAAETGEVSAAALFRYLSTPPSRPRFVVVKPVYRAGVPQVTSQERRAAVIGYTSMGMPAEEMIAGILQASGMLRTPGVALAIYMGEGGADNLAYREPMEAAKDTSPAWPWTDGNTRRRASQSFQVAGVAWRVEVEGTGHASEAGAQPGSWLVALFGATISIMAALYLWALGSRTRRVHELVADRTAALNTVNARLNADIAARERVEGMLRRTDRTLKNAQRIAHVGSWEIDIDTGVHHWSDECFRIFGLAPSVDGVPALDALPPASREMWRAIQARLQSGGVDSEERRIVRPDGSVRHLMLHAELGGERGLTAAGSVLDISEFKRVETELRQSQASLRELGGHQERIKENERKRIAREIHDELGGLLTGIKAYVSVASSRVGDHAAAAPLLAEAMVQADTALDTVRRVIADLRPSVLDQLGVWEAIEWQASQLEAQTGVPCHFTVDPDLPGVGPDGDAMLFRIAQEALTNVARHANASSVEIRAGRDGDDLLLEVEDDGMGIAFDHLSAQSTWGLRGMHERAHYLGGNLRFSNADGGGTVVTLRLPLIVKIADVGSYLANY